MLHYIFKLLNENENEWKLLHRPGAIQCEERGNVMWLVLVQAYPETDWQLGCVQEKGMMEPCSRFTLKLKLKPALCVWTGSAMHMIHTCEKLAILHVETIHFTYRNY